MKEYQVDWSILHSPEEMQMLSNIGHWIEGSLLATVAIIALLEALGLIKWRLVWQSLLFIAGIFLIAYLLLHHGVDNIKLVWNLIWKDAQQRQHLLMAFLLCLAGLSEILAKKYKASLLLYVWPIALSIIGIMFLVHEQHGTSEAVKRAQTIHIYLGISLILVSIVVTVGRITAGKYRWPAYVWPGLLLATSILLLTYREPGGAYRKPGNTHGNEKNLH